MTATAHPSSGDSRDVEAPTRLSADETRKRMLEVAVELLDAEGLRPSVEFITLERVVREAGVPRSSAYNAWKGADPDRAPQAAFQRALMQEVVERGFGVREIGPIMGAASTVLKLDETITAEQRKAELLRVAVEGFVEMTASKPIILVSAALLGAASTNLESDLAAEVLEWAAETERLWREKLAETLYKPLADALGMVPRPDFDGPEMWEQFATAVIATTSGMQPRSAMAPDITQGIMRPGPDGPVEWSLLAIITEAIVDKFLMFPDEEGTH